MVLLVVVLVALAVIVLWLFNLHHGIRMKGQAQDGGDKDEDLAGLASDKGFQEKAKAEDAKGEGREGGHSLSARKKGR